VFIIKNKGICLVLFIFFLSILTSCGTSNNTSTKVVNIDNVVKETFLTDKGYSEELSKHVSGRVFKYTNIYNVYAVNEPQYKKPFKVDFSLKEDSQSVKKDIVYVKMTYSVMIKDATGKSIGGSKDVPITFTVKIIGSNWYITDKYEPA
jgi:hypothetical protein